MMSLLFLFSACICPVIGLIIMYNLVYFLKKKYIEETYNEKQELRVKLYKKRTVYFSIVFILFLSFILVYGRVVSFLEILDFKTEDKIVTLEVYGNITEDERIDLNKNQIDNLVSILEEYEYRRTFNINDIGGKASFFTFENKEGKYKIIEIRENGYLKIGNDKVYSIELGNKENLYNALEKAITYK